MVQFPLEEAMLDVSRIEKIVYGFNFLLYVAMIDTKTHVYSREIKYGFDGWTSDRNNYVYNKIKDISLWLMK